jgi:hypothetical protein
MMTKSFFTYFWLNIVSFWFCIKSILGKLYYSRMVGSNSGISGVFFKQIKVGKIWIWMCFYS